MVDKKLISRIGLLRKKLGITQVELAFLVGVTENTIANWESGRRGIEWIERVERLCKILKCTPSELITYEEEITQESSERTVDSVGYLREKKKRRSSTMERLRNRLAESESEVLSNLEYQQSSEAVSISVNEEYASEPPTGVMQTITEQIQSKLKDLGLKQAHALIKALAESITESIENTTDSSTVDSIEKTLRDALKDLQVARNESADLSETSSGDTVESKTATRK